MRRWRSGRKAGGRGCDGKYYDSFARWVEAALCWLPRSLGSAAGVPKFGTQENAGLSGRDDRKNKLEGGAGGDLADFGIFDGAAAEFFGGGLEHGAAEVVAVDVAAGERFEEAAERLDYRVDFRQAG